MTCNVIDCWGFCGIRFVKKYPALTLASYEVSMGRQSWQEARETMEDCSQAALVKLLLEHKINCKGVKDQKNFIFICNSFIFPLLAKNIRYNTVTKKHKLF